MNARQTAVSLLAAVAFAAAAPMAQAAPMLHDVPGPDTVREIRTASLLHHLRIEYADTHQRGVHNEIVLALNDPAAAFL